MQLPESDFARFRAVLDRQSVDRAVLFEHYTEQPHLLPALHGDVWPDGDPPVGWGCNNARAYAALGYDTWHFGLSWYGTRAARFTYPERAEGASRSQFGAGGIATRDDLERWPWPDVTRDDHLLALTRVQAVSPPRMRCLVGAQGGIYDTLVELFGFERLCMLLADDPELVDAAAARVGTSIIAFVTKIIDHPYVGGIIVCDDWGHKTGTMLSPTLVRRLILPWHERIVAVARSRGKVAVLHACGRVDALMPDIAAIGYQAKHSYEDVIVRVEEAYQRWGRSLAILGGLDVDYLSRSHPAAIRERSRALLDRTRGIGYALGSGNSITSGMPAENIAAMREAAWEWRP